MALITQFQMLILDQPPSNQLMFSYVILWLGSVKSLECGLVSRLVKFFGSRGDRKNC